MKRDKAMRRAIKHTLGSRVNRRANTKIPTKRGKAEKPSARVSAIEQFVNWPPDGEPVTIQ